MRPARRRTLTRPTTAALAVVVLGACLAPAAVAAPQPTPTTPTAAPTAAPTAGKASPQDAAKAKVDAAKKKADADAAAATQAAVAAAQAHLAKIQVQVGQAQLAYTQAQAKLDAAKSSAAAAGKAQAAAAGREQAATARTERAGDKVDQYAANLYKAGPVPQMAQLAVADDASRALDAVSVMKVVANRQANVLGELKVAQDDAQRASADATTARDQAAAALEDAAKAQADAKAAVAAAGKLEQQSLDIVTALLSQADAEGAAARAKSLEQAQALAKLGLALPNFGLGLPPAAATVPGPKPGLPASAGTDPGDGNPGPDHLRPRAERATHLVKELFGVTDVGGWRPSDAVSQDHPSGRAVDVMMGTLGAMPSPENVAKGWAIARWAQANAADLGVSYIIWQGRIWSVARADEGWRDYTKNFPYGSNSNPTTLHMDHVHISFY